jgi:hypothetical protein
VEKSLEKIDMGGVLSTYDQSIEILNAYRTWAAHEESLKTDAGLIVYGRPYPSPKKSPVKLLLAKRDT